MNDEMDYYLDRSIKNWAAKHQPPIGGRERLLDLAGSAPVQRERQIIRAMNSVWAAVFGRDWIYSEASVQSRPWFLHLDANTRLAFF